MPFFGLIWVASWVGCFFPSHQVLLKQPRYFAEIPLPIASEIFDSSQRRVSLEQIQSTVTGSVSSRMTAAMSRAAAPPASDRTDNSPRTAWFNVMNFLFSPATESRSVGVSVLPASLTSAPIEVVQVMNPSIGLMQNLVWGWRLIAGAPRLRQLPKVTVNSAPSQGLEADCGDQAACVVMPVSTGFAPRPAAIFQVRVKNQVIAEVLSQQQANQVAQQLRQSISDPQFEPSQIQPGFDRQTPAGRRGDRILFTVDSSIAKAWGCHAEVLAIRWVNALRSTLGAESIALADAQAKMHNLQETELEIQGLASWYGPYFHGRQTATGEIFDQGELTAAHPSLPFDTYLKVTNLKNGKSVIVRINDRGPYFDNRTLDLSYESARLIDSEQTGVVPIVARIMHPTRNSAPQPQSLAQL